MKNIEIPTWLLSPGIVMQISDTIAGLPPEHRKGLEPLAAELKELFLANGGDLSNWEHEPAVMFQLGELRLWATTAYDVPRDREYLTLAVVETGGAYKEGQVVLEVTENGFSSVRLD